MLQCVGEVQRPLWRMLDHLEDATQHFQLQVVQFCFRLCGLVEPLDDFGDGTGDLTRFSLSLFLSFFTYWRQRWSQMRAHKPCLSSERRTSSMRCPTEPSRKCTSTWRLAHCRLC